MLELGPASAELHHEAGRAAAAGGKLDWIIGVQGDSENFVRGAVEAGHPGTRAKFYASSVEAGEFLGNLIERGDVLLVKGSRGVKMERIVEALDTRFARAQAESTASVASGTPEERA
jgi:UDP-N-acetylmuramoyl-tripeptide--D-alanyl-D-alanine ligase